MWQGSQLSKSNIKGHIAVFASLTTKEVHLEAATILASTPVEVKIWRFITRRREIWQIYSKNKERNILTCYFEKWNCNSWKN